MAERKFFPGEIVRLRADDPKPKGANRNDVYKEIQNVDLEVLRYCDIELVVVRRLDGEMLRVEIWFEARFESAPIREGDYVKFREESLDEIYLRGIPKPFKVQEISPPSSIQTVLVEGAGRDQRFYTTRFYRVAPPKENPPEQKIDFKAVLEAAVKEKPKRQVKTRKRERRRKMSQTNKRAISCKQFMEAAPGLKSVMELIWATPDLFNPVAEMVTRTREFQDIGLDTGTRQHTAVLAAIAANSRTRALMDLAIDRAVRKDTNYLLDHFSSNSEVVPELVIGAGPTAAVWVAQRAMMGLPSLVVDQRLRLGGQFGIAERPVFFLNSRNRREDLRVRRQPGTRGPLNSLVGATLQPSDFSGGEYQTQYELGTAVRINIARAARCITGQRVLDVARPGGADFFLVTLNDVSIRASRVVWAAGMGKPRNVVKGLYPDVPSIFSFDEFVQRVGAHKTVFPLIGYKRVAVVGAGDSGKCAVEYLLGQGPDRGMGMSTAAIDFPERIDWFGVPPEQRTRKEFFGAQRPRYAGIGRYIADDKGSYTRVYLHPNLSTINYDGDDEMRAMDANGDYYNVDVIIDCTGYARLERIAEKPPVMNNGRMLGRQAGNEYYVGPYSGIPVTEAERTQTPALRTIPDNSVSIFRYAERTAELGMRLAIKDAADHKPGVLDKALEVKKSKKKQYFSWSTPTRELGSWGSITFDPNVPSEDVLKLAIQEHFGGKRLPELFNSIGFSLQKSAYMDAMDLVDDFMPRTKQFFDGAVNLLNDDLFMSTAVKMIGTVGADGLEFIVPTGPNRQIVAAQTKVGYR